jgi:hypothetical protein
MEPIKVYPFPCTQCRARYFCHCATLEAAGWCRKCKIVDCSCPKIYVFEPICAECLALEKSTHNSCKKCESPYECVCELLIENGNCPICLKLVCKCTPSDKIDPISQ